MVRSRPPGPSRRAVLASLALGSVVPGAGCLDAVEGLGRTDPEPCDGIDDPVQGRGRPVSVERTVPEGDVEYLPEEDAVDLGHDTYDFEWWAEGRAATVAADRVSEAVTERLPGDPYWGGAGVRRRTTVEVQLRHYYDRGGDPIDEPEVDFEQLVGVAPPRASVTIHLAGRTYRREVPVQVRCRAVQQA